MSQFFLDKNKLQKAAKKQVLQNIKDYLSENNLCYVLLTCSSPSKNGNMQVEMAYEGDNDLVSYLMEGAKGVVLDNEK